MSEFEFWTLTMSLAMTDRREHDYYPSLFSNSETAISIMSYMVLATAF